MAVTLSYVVGPLERRRFRGILAEGGYSYSETKDLFNRVFFVYTEIDNHVTLAKEFYRD